jgi:hypothetical protein
MSRAFGTFGQRIGDQDFAKRFVRSGNRDTEPIEKRVSGPGNRIIRDIAIIEMGYPDGQITGRRCV